MGALSAAVTTSAGVGPYCDDCGNDTDPYAHPATAPLCERCRRRLTMLAAGHAAFAFAAYVLILWVAVPRLIADQVGPLTSVQPDQIWLAFYAALAIGICLHEGAHAVCARAVGFTVTGVRVGTGPVLYRGRFRGAVVSFHVLPFSGRTAWRPGFSDVTTTKRMVIATAGPLANLCIAAIAWGLRASDPYLAITAAGANLTLFLQNIVPCPPRTAGGTPNDGWQIARNLAGTHWARTQLHRIELAGRCAAFTGSDAAEQAIAYLRAEISRRGQDDPDAEAMLCTYLLELGGKPAAISEGFERSSRLLEDRRAAPSLRALALNRRAFMLAVGGWPELMEEAEWTAREALRVLPGNPQIVGTLGFVLVRLGRFDEAEPMINSAIRHTIKVAAAGGMSLALARSLAVQRCALGLLYAHTSRRAAAATQKAEAQPLDRSCPLLVELENALAAAV